MGAKTTKLLLLDSLLQETKKPSITMSMVASSLSRLRPAVLRQSRRAMSEKKGMADELPVFDPAAAIPMKYGAVYMAVFLGFWGLCFTVNPFLDRATMDKTYETKWNQTK